MWSLTKNIIFVYIYFNIGFSLADYGCDKPHDDFNAEPADVPLPAYIVNVEQNNATRFQLVVDNITEDVNLTLYVNPFKRDPNDCRETPKNTENLSRFWERPELLTTDGRSPYTFPAAPTGCYYAKMTNRRKQNFIVPITYYNGTTEYYNWNSKCISSIVQPPSPSVGRKSYIKIEVPQQCLKVEIKLFEIQESLRNEILSEDIRKTIQPIGDCWFTNTDYSCKSGKTGFHIERKFNTSGNNKDWRALIEWTELKTEGAHYFSSISMSNDICRKKYSELMTWIPASTLELLDHGKHTTSNIPPDEKEDNSYTSTVQLSLYIVSGLLLIAIFIYCVWMYMRIFYKRGKNVPSPDHEIEERLYIDKILLIYMQSTSDFLEYMQAFKNELKKRCKHEVYDIYSKDEYSAIATLRPYAWVERIIKDGCKIVWIDTPEFRSYLNNRSKLNSKEEKNCIEIDFRDCAIKYALELTKSSFKDSQSDLQYMCHFVVRPEGLDFTDEANDPLSIITPHRRFHIPQHFDRLCADLAK